MLKKLMILPIAAGMLAVNAGAACYQIGTADQLDDFAKAVNDGEKTACAELTADIYYQGTGVQLVKEDLSALNTTKNLRSWTPIGKDDDHVFQGSINGMGHTIYGLYMSNSQAWDASFVSVALGGTVVKNLRVEDSFFKSSSGGNGGIIGKASAGAVLVENCSFKGRIEGGTNNGGIVGSVQNNASLTLKDCYNEGSINGSKQVGGLVGMMGKEPSDNKLSLENCFNVGSAVNNPLVGENQTGKDGNITAQNVGCVSTKGGTFNRTELCSSVVKSGVTLGDSATLAGNFNDNVKAQQVEKINSLPTAKGVYFAYNTKNLLVATIDADCSSLSIASDIDVDEVVFEREFTKSSTSTLMLPFDISASNVIGAEILDFSGVSKKVDDEGNFKEWSADFTTANTTIKAHTPYLVNPQGGKLTFAGSVTLKATSSSENSKVVDDWTLKGLYETKTWTDRTEEEALASLDYGFSGGKFGKIGNNVRVKALRAYLSFTGNPTDAPAAATKALAKMSAVSVVDAAEELPETISVNIIHKDIDVSNILEGIPGTYVDHVEIDDSEEDAMGVAEPTLRPETKDSRWFDTKGRLMNKKPETHGVFINNKKPVVNK